MLNKLYTSIRKHAMLKPGETAICAVSGGADSMALLWAMYLLQEKLQIKLAAAHFNHGLRDAESERDEAFVRDFCAGYHIPCYVGNCSVVSGKKGLEAAARDARYAYFKTLSGKILTAHTADDNAETVLMHMIRGTGLKGLGAIAPVSNNLLRPMLDITRTEVLEFLQSYSICYVNDSSNETDQFLRNRIRHHIMPLLRQENPSFSQNLSATAQRLRQDEALLQSLITEQDTLDVAVLRTLPSAQLHRQLTAFLCCHGVKEPTAEHIALLTKLVFSDKPSARAVLPGNLTVCRNYDRLQKAQAPQVIQASVLPCPGTLDLPEQGIRIHCDPNAHIPNSKTCFTVLAEGDLIVRHRIAGDSLRTSGGTKLVKQLFIDQKIPADQRLSIPVVADSAGVLGVYGLGGHKDRLSDQPNAITIHFETINKNT